jgi:hypothetical protein
MTVILITDAIDRVVIKDPPYIGIQRRKGLASSVV